MRGFERLLPLMAISESPSDVEDDLVEKWNEFKSKCAYDEYVSEKKQSELRELLHFYRTMNTVFLVFMILHYLEIALILLILLDKCIRKKEFGVQNVVRLCMLLACNVIEAVLLFRNQSSAAVHCFISYRMWDCVNVFLFVSIGLLLAYEFNR